MILSGKEIKNRLDKDIFIKPFNEKQLNPNSYNMKLHNVLYIYNNKILRMNKENPLKSIVIENKGILLYPGNLYLGRTVEYTKTKNLVPIISGRSSIGRLGINIHATAGFGDNGFEGYWTLEISVIQPVVVFPFIEICQIYYNTIIYDNEPIYYKGKYQNNCGIQGSMLYNEIKDNEK